MEYFSDILLYLATFLSSSAFVCYGLKKLKYKNTGIIHVAIGLLIPSILAGIRYGVGVDYFSYLGMYNNVVDGQEMYFRSIEPASSMIIDISALIHSSIFMFFCFNLITNICMLIAFSRFFKSDPNKITLAYLLYLCILYPTTLNAIRSGAAISITTLAFSYLAQKNKKKNIIYGIILILLAALFHKSAYLALAFMPVFIITNSKLKRLNVKKGIVWLGYLLAAIFTSSILPYDILSFGGEYSRYLTDFGDSFSIPVANIIMSLPILIGLVHIAMNNENDNPNYKKIVYLASFYIPLTVLTGWVTSTGGLSRISFLFDPLVICLMVYLINDGRRGVVKTLKVFAVIMVVLLMFFRNLNWSGALPYQNVFQQEIVYEFTI